MAFYGELFRKKDEEDMPLFCYENFYERKNYGRKSNSNRIRSF